MSVCAYRPPEDAGHESLDLPEGVPPLRSLYLYLSSSCNLSCRHCWITPRLVNAQPDPGEVIDVKALRAAIAEAKPLGLSSVKLTGGEPLLHPCFREICDLATREELDLVMETNGTLLTADLARYLKNETSMEFISVSIDSADAARHDAFRGRTALLPPCCKASITWWPRATRMSRSLCPSIAATAMRSRTWHGCRQPMAPHRSN